MPKWVKILIASVCSLAVVVGGVFGGYKIYEHNLYNKDLEMPVFAINTEDSKDIVSKEEYIGCEVSVSNTKEEFSFKNKAGKIKGRGNSTWTESNKKPYKLKFEEKVDLFGNGKSKTWTLIANFQDNSGIRNYLAYAIGNTFDDLKYTSKTQFVDLWLNGEYVGVYLVCEQVETGTNRVDIEEDLISPENTGYLIEQDGRAPDEGEEGVDYFVCEGRNFALKTPDTEDEEYSTAYLEYIKGYFEQCFVALKGDDFSAVQSLIDVNTFADSYIVNELFKNNDVDYSSFYLYKDAGGKLCSGPIWDYDSCAGNSPKAEDNKTNTIVATKNKFYSHLMEFDEFKQILKNKINKYYEPIEDLIEDECEWLEENYEKSFKRNYKKWKCTYRLSSVKGWENNVEYLEEWLEDSLKYLKKTYC